MPSTQPFRLILDSLQRKKRANMYNDFGEKKETLEEVDIFNGCLKLIQKIMDIVFRKTVLLLIICLVKGMKSWKETDAHRFLVHALQNFSSSG